MSNQDEIDDRDLSMEADRVTKDILPYVQSVQTSKILEMSPTVAYINIKTIENIEMCVRLSIQGYEVVGECFDQADKTADKAYESIEQLLDAISPAYRQSFADALSKKLAQISQESS